MLCPFLTADLHRTVAEGNYQLEIIDVRLQSLKVSLVVGKAAHCADPARLSDYSEYHTECSATTEKPRGAFSTDPSDEI